MILTMDGGGVTLATIDLGPTPKTPSRFTTEYDEGALSATGGNLYLYLDGEEWGSLWFHVSPEGTPRILLGQFDHRTEDWEPRNPLVESTYDTERQVKTQIIVHSWHTPDSAGGFDWEPAFNENISGLRAAFDADVASEDWEHVTLCRFEILGYAQGEPGSQARVEITEYIDNHLLDLIETRQIGHIIASHDRSGIHPRVTAGLTLERNNE